jgi:hypothetical protein
VLEGNKHIHPLISVKVTYPRYVLSLNCESFGDTRETWEPETGKNERKEKKRKIVSGGWKIVLPGFSA